MRFPAWHPILPEHVSSVLQRSHSPGLSDLPFTHLLTSWEARWCQVLRLKMR